MGQKKTRIDAHFVAAGKFHDIDFARLEVLKLLAEHDHVRTTVACDYSNTDRLANCAFLITYTCDLVPSPEEVRVLKAFVERGGRWLALHGTNSILRFTEGGVDCPEDRPDMMEMLGSQFKAHPPIVDPFRVEITDRDHDVTRGLDDFDVLDELYLMKMLSDVRTLAQTTFTGEATGFVEADWPETTVPVIYEKELGQGAIHYNALGHCRGHYDLPGMEDFYTHPEKCAWNYPVYYELLRRGIVWAMQGSGAQPVKVV
ncbi:ThuA domain-containing protein [Erythrobacter sp.]|jgi:type 1 glutamine amidotransferase|uniref:ThuA domain-containing protein n=1 Tax=Erythrobacter sp. TaxID=1042 RepID=UPI002EC25ACF|nr:ThuA domain-containing protein [Erythrobacter sp.]